MSDKWYAASRLVGLPGLPGTARRIKAKAQREQWEDRPRRDVGGGLEYNIDSLPIETRKAIAAAKPVPTGDAAQSGKVEARKLAVAKKAQKDRSKKNLEAGLQGAIGLNKKEQQRDQARTLILRDWEGYRAISGESVNPSLESYALLYSLQQREGLDEAYKVIKKVSASTMQKWRRQLKTKGHLGASYGNRKGHSKIDSQPDIKDFVVAMLVEFPHCKASQVIQGLESRFAGRTDINLPSQGRLNAWMNTWKEQNAQLFTAVTNPDEWKNRYMSAFGSRSEHIVRLNQLWEFDGTPADVMFTDGRHSINGVVDVYSRRGMMFVTPTAKSAAVAAIIRKALLHWGVMEEAKTDNGSDYTSFFITRVFDSLGVEQTLCNPFSPWEKPHVERFFRTFAHDLVELLPGFIGHSVADRKAIEARKTFSDRLFKKNEVVEINMTAAEFQQFADDWCEKIYHHNKHSELGKTPFQQFAEWDQPIRKISNERALDLLLAPAATKKGDGLCTVTKGKSITIDKIDYFSPDLWAYIGQQVRALEDPTDFGRIYVYGGDNFQEFICIAESIHTGVDRAEVAARAKELQKQVIQEKKRELKKLAKKVNVAGVAQEILEHRRAEAGKVVALPKPEQEYTSPALESATQAVEAMSTPDNSALVERTAILREALKKAEAEQAQFEQNSKQSKQATKQSDSQLYQRWMTIDQDMVDGKQVSEADRRFHAEFQQTAAYRTQKMMAEDFADYYRQEA